MGTRLASLVLPRAYNWARYAGAVLYGVTTPIGIAVGIGIRRSYAPGSSRALVTNGFFDSISAGVLLWTGLVEVRATLHACRRVPSG